MLQSVCCSVLQFVTLCCRVFTWCCSLLKRIHIGFVCVYLRMRIAMCQYFAVSVCCSMLQGAAAWWIVLQCVPLRCSVLRRIRVDFCVYMYVCVLKCALCVYGCMCVEVCQYFALSVCCSVLRCAAMCYIVLQSFTSCRSVLRDFCVDFVCACVCNVYMQVRKIHVEIHQ